MIKLFGEVAALNGLTIVFTIIIALFILLFYLGCPTPGRAELNSCGRRSFNKRDALTLGLIVIIYSAVAFYNLGDTTAPQSFHRFESGENVVLDLESEQTVSSVMFYDGLGTGSYTLEYSHDGEYWYKAAELSQDYASLFKWISAEFVDGIDAQTRYIRICANDGLYLGEVAVEGENGELLKYRTDAIELCDEQSVVPDYQYYLNSTYFDEIYHARTAYEYIHRLTTYENTHPPLGKLMMSVFIAIFGMTPFGWRFAGCLMGILMLPAMYLLGKQLTKRSSMATVAMTLMALDCMHFTQTRIATIDSFPVLFMMLMFLFMARWMKMSYYHQRLRDTFVPLALSGAFMGLAIASKWIGCYGAVGLAILFFARFYSLWRQSVYAGTHRDEHPAFARAANLFARNGALTIAACCVFFVAVPVIIYVLS